jgi:hypothetical protein
MRFLITNLDGLALSIITHHDPEAFTDGVLYNDQYIINLEEYPYTIDDTTLIKTLHWTGTELGTHEPQVNKFQVWNKDTFSWNYPANYIELLQDEAIKQLNNIAGVKILQKYPIYKQLNYPRTEETLASEMYLWIDNIRTLSNESSDAIRLETTLEGMEAIIQDFMTATVDL